MFELKEATMIYDMDKEEKVYAMKGMNLTFPDKGLVGIIGPSGSGKSTLMYTMSTLKNSLPAISFTTENHLRPSTSRISSTYEEMSSDSCSRDTI